LKHGDIRLGQVASTPTQSRITPNHFDEQFLRNGLCTVKVDSSPSCIFDAQAFELIAVHEHKRSLLVSVKKAILDPWRYDAVASCPDILQSTF
jgi:hypothetical protein